MKGTKFLALMLCLALCLGLAVPALGAAAARFTDVEGHWALEPIQNMTQRGLFVGYNEPDGSYTFRPNNPVVECESLALCARIMIPADTRAQILADRAEQVGRYLPSDYWFSPEAATCLELGVLDEADLEFLTEDNMAGLFYPTTRADFAVYLVRAMGLEEMALSLSADTLPFGDDADIAPQFRHYVKLLYNFGVVIGDDLGNFNPHKAMTRAECCTMLDRAITNVVDKRGVSLELSQFTRNSWVSGYVQSVEPAADGRVLTLLSPLSGEHTVVLASDTPIYQYNILSLPSVLKIGAFVRVNFAADGKSAASLRVIPADVELSDGALLRKVQGTCGEVSLNSVTVNGVAYTIDRFTEVSAGGKVLDRTIIDRQANYTGAELVCDRQGTVLWLALTGGTRQMEGLLTGMESFDQAGAKRDTITITSFGGQSTVYALTDDVTLLANGQPAALNATMNGAHVVYRVSDADPAKLVTLTVDLSAQYRQGVVITVNPQITPQSIQLRPVASLEAATYQLDPECVITFDGKEAELANLTSTFATIKLVGGTITELSAWPGSEVVSGTLDHITYADPTVLVLTREDGTTAEFSIPTADLAAIPVTSKGAKRAITDIHNGDSVTVTLLYNAISQIDFIPRSANLSGTLSSIAHYADNTSALTVTLSTGEVKTFYTTAATTVSQKGGGSISVYLLKISSNLDLVVDGDKLLSVTVTGAPVRKDRLEGSLYLKDERTRILQILVDGQPTKVYLPNNVLIRDVNTNADLSLSRLNPGDELELWGSFDEDHVFQVTSGIRK